MNDTSIIVVNPLQHKFFLDIYSYWTTQIFF